MSLLNKSRICEIGRIDSIGIGHGASITPHHLQLCCLQFTKFSPVWGFVGQRQPLLLAHKSQNCTKVAQNGGRLKLSMVAINGIDTMASENKLAQG